MVNLSSFSVINEKVKNLKSDLDLDTTGAAFIRFALDVLLRINDDEIEETITDGSADGGLDAVYINYPDVHLFSFKYSEEFEQTKKNFPEKDLDSLVITVQGIFSNSLQQGCVNAAVWEKHLEIYRLFHEGKLNFKIYIVSNKEKPTQSARDKFERALDVIVKT